MELTKRVVKGALQMDTDAELARLFGIGRWAVGQWPDDQPIPEGRQWQLRALRPDLFPTEDGHGSPDPERRSAAANEGVAAVEPTALKNAA
jgi:hypothetical protein